MELQMTFELHPLCTLFPRLGDAEFSSLVEDIRANGLREPIIIHDGMILDGGNRYRACLDAGIEPATMKFGGGNIVSYVLSANLHRRHLSVSQQAAIVASAQNWATAQIQGANRHTIKTGNLAGLETVADRQAQSGASDRTQRMADKVAKANPELAKEVGRGEISLPKAVEEITGKRPGTKPPKFEVVHSAEIPEGQMLIDVEEFDIIKAQLLETLAENTSMSEMCDADDKLKAAADEIKALIAEITRLNAVIATLESRNAGLIGEKNQAVKIAKQWKATAERLERAA